jgi:hypothetical protein
MYLARKMENLRRARVLLGQQTRALLGNGKVEGLQFLTGDEIEADLGVIAAGIRPTQTTAVRRTGGEPRHRGQRTTWKPRTPTSRRRRVHGTSRAGLFRTRGPSLRSG